MRMNPNTTKWFFHQLTGLLVITALSLILAFGVNAFRSNPFPWIEKRRLLRAGDWVPYVLFSKSIISGHQTYLGLPEEKEMVTLSEIQADLLVIEVLNTFCFPCQTQSLVLNKVYEMIEEKAGIKGRIKILGLALGNTKQNVENFIEDYDLKFPVIPDPEGRSEKIIGPGIYTPFALFIRRDAAGVLREVVGTHSGPVEDPEKMFNVLKTLLTEDLEAGPIVDKLSGAFSKGS